MALCRGSRHAAPDMAVLLLLRCLQEPRRPVPQQHGRILHAVEHTTLQHLTAERYAEIEVVANQLQRAMQQQQPAAVPDLMRRHKQLLARLAAAQLAEQPLVPPPNSPEGQQLALDVAAALATRGCAYVGCHNMAGASEVAAKGRKCGGCKAVRYCSEECSKADWRRHRPACRLLKAQAAASTAGQA